MTMRTVGLLSAALIFGGATSAQAAVVILESVTPVSDGFEFDYQVTLGPDEGLRAGDRLVIFDFEGYVEGSVFSTGTTAASVEFTSLPFLSVGYSDDPNVVNLVFTYTGPDFRNVDGPFESLLSNGFGAVSTFGLTRLDAFTSATTKNNPQASENTALIQGGVTQVPSAIPEPASWAMLVAGFGMIGATVRRRRTVFAHTAA